jgi:hypothetical protein
MKLTVAVVVSVRGKSFTTIRASHSCTTVYDGLQDDDLDAKLQAAMGTAAFAPRADTGHVMQVLAPHHAPGALGQQNPPHLSPPQLIKQAYKAAAVANRPPFPSEPQPRAPRPNGAPNIRPLAPTHAGMPGNTQPRHPAPQYQGARPAQHSYIQPLSPIYTAAPGQTQTGVHIGLQPNALHTPEHLMSMHRPSVPHVAQSQTQPKSNAKKAMKTHPQLVV